MTDDQEKMNYFFKQMKLVESRWFAMHKRRIFYAQWSQLWQLWWINGHWTSFLPLVFFIDMHWRVRPFQNTWKWFRNT